jgi:hypothetical protein
MTPIFRELDPVVIVRDIPQAGLRAGDLGTIVMQYDATGFEVEVVKASGNAQAVVTLSAQDIRPMDDDDVLSVRPSNPLA